MKAAVVLIDSSVWVAAARKTGDAGVRQELAALFQAGRSAMSWPAWVELHRGAQGRREEENLNGRRQVSRWLEFDDACWSAAAATARACQQAGVNVPFGDVLVHACATRHGVELLECDRHFAMLRRATEG
jgi:predicted nucleic acid-binding protein